MPPTWPICCAWDDSRRRGSRRRRCGSCASWSATAPSWSWCVPGSRPACTAVLAKQGLHLSVTDMFGPRGRAELAAAPLDRAYRARVNAYLRLIDTLDPEVEMADGWIAARLATDPGYRAIQHIPGVGPVWAAVFVAEIGDVTRFASARHLCSWAGLTPRHRESDTTVHRGAITKQGSTLVRWAAIEAAQRSRTPPDGWSPREQITARRGRNIATVAVARRLLTLVYYGLRDGHIRALPPPVGRHTRRGGRSMIIGRWDARSFRSLVPDSWRRAEGLIDPVRSGRRTPCPRTGLTGPPERRIAGANG